MSFIPNSSVKEESSKRSRGVGEYSQIAEKRRALAVRTLSIVSVVARTPAHVVKLDGSVKTTPAVRTYAPTLPVCERTKKIGGGVGMDGLVDRRMLMCLLA